MLDKAPNWLAWARELQALAQTGLHFCSSHYDRDRYLRLQEIAGEILRDQAGVGIETAVESFSLQPGYATPKVDVRGAVVREGKILLVQERQDQGWCLPGGWADVGETPAEMVVREVREESGLEVRAVKLIGVYDANRTGTPLEFYHAYKLVFLCERLAGDPSPGEETLAVGYFSPEALPPLSSERTSLRHITEIWEHARDSNRPAAFD